MRWPFRFLDFGPTEAGLLCSTGYTFKAEAWTEPDIKIYPMPLGRLRLAYCAAQAIRSRQRRGQNRILRYIQCHWVWICIIKICLQILSMTYRMNVYEKLGSICNYWDFVCIAWEYINIRISKTIIIWENVLLRSIRAQYNGSNFNSISAVTYTRSSTKALERLRISLVLPCLFILVWLQHKFYRIHNSRATAYALGETPSSLS